MVTLRWLALASQPHLYVVQCLAREEGSRIHWHLGEGGHACAVIHHSMCGVHLVWLCTSEMRPP